MTERKEFKERISVQKMNEEKDTLQKKNEWENTEHGYSWPWNDPETPSIVSEALAEYRVQKRQGEYTVEDYLALPDDQRVELIDGMFFVMYAPTYIHQDIGSRICQSFRDYIDGKHGSCYAFVSPIDVQLDCDDRTMVQPDVVIICDPSKLKKGRIFGAPDLIVEILSKSTSKKDRGLKLAKYKRAGVREYWIVDPDWRQIRVYEFEKSDTPREYEFEETVPVGIYDGDCKVDFSQIYERVRPLYDTM